jgi:hypothetical protein
MLPRRSVVQIRFWWLLVAFLSGMALAMFAEELILSSRDNRLEFAPQIPFLRGEPLARLHNAAAVPFDIQVTLWSGSRNHVFRQNRDRFVVSFDIWQEDFSVTKTQAPRKTISHLTASGVESWCMNQMSMDLTGLSSSERFWARLEIRAENPAKDGGLFGRGSVSESGISLTNLIEIFSRPPQAEQAHWALEAGGRTGLTLDELRRRNGRGS